VRELVIRDIACLKLISDGDEIRGKMTPLRFVMRVTLQWNVVPSRIVAWVTWPWMLGKKTYGNYRRKISL
jgi:hypothetical protein